MNDLDSEDGEFIVLRGGIEGNRSPVLLMAPASDHPSPASFDRMNQTYGLQDENQILGLLNRSCDQPAPKVATGLSPGFRPWEPSK
jgi:hypothetical protein